MPSNRPVYIDTYESGLLREKIKAAYDILRACTLCPRACGIDRLSGETGVCKTADRAWVSSYSPHFGEEAPLVGQNGSGTIFFTHCNLLCLFCQNFGISHQGDGAAVSDGQLADMMLSLQNEGCHNINFVTPTHVVPQILSALGIAVEGGLRVPLVYNSSGYDNTETLGLLEGVFDIYMPDFKFWDPSVAEMACNARDYPHAARAAIKEMHRQVGDLNIDSDGVARRGLLLRHLVLPNGMAGTRDVMGFVAESLSPDTYVNIMSQYRPWGRASEIPGFSAGISDEEYQAAVQAAGQVGIHRLDPPRRVFVFG